MKVYIRPEVEFIDFAAEEITTGTSLTSTVDPITPPGEGPNFDEG